MDTKKNTKGSTTDGLRSTRMGQLNGLLDQWIVGRRSGGVPTNFALADLCFAEQSECMEPNWAEDNLQTIRTLMERSAVYRRALAPIMIYVGLLGVAAAVAGYVFQYDSLPNFETLWTGTALVAVAGAFLIARRQAFKDKEPFWSPPTRRVIQAMAPALSAGALVSLFEITLPTLNSAVALIVFWLFFYGCALHSAGFFTVKGIKGMGWAYIAIPPLLIGSIQFTERCLHLGFFTLDVNWLMGAFFGVPHIACGAYLYFTEKKNPVA